MRACYVGRHQVDGSVEVLHGVDLQIAPGTVTAVLGPNGAGKSTLLSVLAGLNDASAGEVIFDGTPVRAGTGHTLVHAGVHPHPIAERDDGNENQIEQRARNQQ